MARRARSPLFVQAWIELRAEDPDALSTLEVARTRLAAGRGLESVRRLRVFELSGRLPGADEIRERLHRSTQFYNPHKESCTVRAEASGLVPVSADEWMVLVFERGGERRAAAERWWHHETGRRIEVREGMAWILGFGRAGGGREAVEELAELRDRGHGLLCNPHSQEFVVARGAFPMPLWSGPPGRAAPARSEGE